MHIKSNTVIISINITFILCQFHCPGCPCCHLPSLSSHPWAVGPHTPLVTVKRNPLNVDLVLQDSQGPRLQSLSDVQALRQLPELDGPPNVQPFRESSLKGLARTRLLRVRRRKRRRKVMLPPRVRLGLGRRSSRPSFICCQRGDFFIAVFPSWYEIFYLPIKHDNTAFKLPNKCSTSLTNCILYICSNPREVRGSFRNTVSGVLLLQLKPCYLFFFIQPNVKWFKQEKTDIKKNNLDIIFVFIKKSWLLNVLHDSTITKLTFGKKL